MSARWRLLALAPLLAFGGCGDDAPQCLLDTDCPLGQRCAEERCVERGTAAPRRDGGAGTDGGATDGGPAVDSGLPPVDSGFPDLDSGFPPPPPPPPPDDGGLPGFDLGLPTDAGTLPDAGAPADAGTPAP